MPGKPRSPKAATLTREGIVRAAVAIADADGLGAVTMRSVARRLDVEAMSLYHHVANKEAMLDAMVDAVFDEFHAPRVGEDWADEMRQRSRSARTVLKRHPWAVGLMDSRRHAGYATLLHHDAVLGCLRTAGFSIALTGHAFALLDAHLYGFLIQELALPFEGGDDLAELGDQMIAALPDGALPYFREFALEHALQPGYEFGDEFDVGLDLIIEGLAARLAAEVG
ncbi:TetR/AcrR family transcriptional regulator C-terminal domain-containing protein [Gordonia rhizosphera]|uniref:Putative TetR family transcriptional regulator n=1 Tax=Gordonia rhizosphera NBRC 16068 TaxID=1108045 RepID=K6VTL0_9ACTN|nr:TetR/AcrR family transcriptional regulator C-terminal domain-containing protein [Gordonia rhizosphera]GAB90245.1 putative TetR family transcriptional regulator [Gordonia rhizosphera NBRC 16068]